MKLKFILPCALLLFACEHKAPTPPENGSELSLPQWPMFGKNLRNTSNAADPVEYYSGPKQGSIEWKFEISGLFTCSPSISAEGTIYIASSPCDCINADSGFVYAINPNGSVKWRFRTNGPNYSTGALGQDGTYYYGSGDGYFYAIDRAGNLKWKRRFSFFDVEARPGISKSGDVIVSVRPGVTAMEAETGKVIWFYEAPTVNGFGIAISEDGTIYTGTENTLLALTSTGLKKWEFTLPHGPQDVAIGNDGTIYFQLSEDSLLYAFHPNGTLKWTFNVQGEARNNIPAISLREAIYAINSGIIPPKLYRLNSEGEVELEIELTGFSPHSNPIADIEETIYLPVLAKGGDFWAIDRNGRTLWGVSIEDPNTTIYAKPAMTSVGVLYVAGDFSLNAIR